MNVTKTITRLLLAAFAITVFPAHAQNIITFAGGGASGLGDGGPATAATLNNPATIAVDAAGNVFIADMGNNRVRRVNTAGIITTVAGGGAGGDGIPAVSAALHQPNGVCVDNAGNLFITEMASTGGNKIRKVNTAGIISTVAGNGTPGFSGDGGPATLAKLDMPSGVAVDGSGNVYIADWGNNRIRMVDATGTITTIAGGGATLGDGGPAISAMLNNPYSVSLDIFGNLFVSDEHNYRLRKISASGIITTVAGTGVSGSTGDGGPATAALFDQPDGIVADAGSLYIADYSNNRIRKVDLPTGIVTNAAGTGIAGFSGDGAAATAATLNGPTGVALDIQGNVYISDFVNNRIRRININNRVPLFTGGHLQLMTICENAIAVPIDYLLPVIDSDIGQTETWSLLSAPWHGSAVVTYTTTSTGGVLTPSGLSYTPSAGYWGTDTFRVKADDRISIDTTTIVVTINPLPHPGPVRGAANVCRGSTITLSDDTTGGTWNATNANATVSAGVVTGVSGGRDTIQYAVTNACGTTTVIKVVTIDTLPAVAPITGATDVCLGSGIVLSDATAGGAWSAANASASVTAGAVIGLSPGTDTIRYTFSNSCGVATVSHTLTVSIMPYTNPITGPASDVCAGSAITLSENVSGGVWGTRTHKATVSPTGIVTGASAGIDTVTYSITNACGSAHAAYTVTVLAAPNAGTILGLNYVCPGHTVILGDWAPGGTWTSSNSAICTVNPGGVVTGVTPGAATISYAVTNSCGTAATWFPLTVLPYGGCPGSNGAGINNLSQGINTIRVFPNPAAGTFTLQLPDGVEHATITIYNLLGKTIRTLEAQQSENIISTTTIPAGIYLIRVQTEAGIYVEKLQVL